jgi:hypothetical protein
MNHSELERSVHDALNDSSDIFGEIYFNIYISRCIRNLFVRQAYLQNVSLQHTTSLHALLNFISFYRNCYRFSPVWLVDAKMIQIFINGKCRRFHSYLYFKAAKSLFNAPREKLSPRPLAAEASQSRGCIRY